MTLDDLSYLIMTHMEGGEMDKRERIRFFEEMAKIYDEQLAQAQSRLEQANREKRSQVNEVGILEWRKWWAMTNRDRVERGWPEIPDCDESTTPLSYEVDDTFDDLGPEDGVPLH